MGVHCLNIVGFVDFWVDLYNIGHLLQKKKSIVSIVVVFEKFISKICQFEVVYGFKIIVSVEFCANFYQIFVNFQLLSNKGNH
jgi:hypothetical protein